MNEEKYIKAFAALARHIEQLPGCDYRVRDEVLDILGYEWIPGERSDITKKSN